MCQQNASYLAKHSELGSKSLNKIWVKVFKKHKNSYYSMKIFKIASGNHTPREPFLFLNQVQISIS